MDQEQANDSRSALLQRWLDVLHRWEEKRSHYQIELDKTTDPAKQQELEQGIESCEHVIQTSQGLIQALSDRNPQQPISGIEPPTESWLLPDDSASEPTAQDPPSAPPVPPASPLPGIAPANVPSSPVVAQSMPSTLPSGEDLAPETISPILPPPVQPWQMPLPPTATPPSTAKRLLKVGLPLLILVAAGFAMFRPRNVCKLAPNGAYSNTGLALWVQQTLANSDDADSARTVSIGQYGCTIILEGVVSSVEEQRNIITLTQGIKLPSQAPAEQIKRALGLDAAEVRPVQGVVSKLKVESVPDIEP
jgi:hypothetical protein